MGSPHEGTVDWFDPEKGVGMIKSDVGGASCHVHAGALRGYASLSKGDRVRFRMRGEGGQPTASDVLMLDEWENEGGAVPL